MGGWVDGWVGGWVGERTYVDAEDGAKENALVGIAGGARSLGDERFLLEEVGGWVGFVFTLVSGWVGDGKIEEDEAVRMSYCELGVGG